MPSKGSSRPVREALIEAAYELFSRNGIRGVGVDSIIARAGVAKMSFYRYFPSKDHLVLAFLDRREKIWTYEWLVAEMKGRAAAPADQLLVIFDIFDEWFQRKDFEGCSFIRTMLETLAPEQNEVLGAARSHFANVRLMLQRVAEEANLPRPVEFAFEWQILMSGSIVAAADGDKLAGKHAREVGEILLAQAYRKE
jgi:AcrR family transcriptional regulator